jgi:hypothetical protein
LTDDETVLSAKHGEPVVRASSGTANRAEPKVGRM